MQRMGRLGFGLRCAIPGAFLIGLSWLWAIWSGTGDGEVWGDALPWVCSSALGLFISVIGFGCGLVLYKPYLRQAHDHHWSDRIFPE